MKIILFVFAVLSSTISSCQSAEWLATSGGQLSIQTSSHSMFPHPERMNGHSYGDTLFSFEASYNDSSVAIFVPDHFKSGESVDLVFYFHGWGNKIQESFDKFDLLNQFSASKKNAIFVFPEGPKDASDSFGGKLEEKDVFKSLVGDVLAFLKNQKIIKRAIPGQIILAGHSGAYRVISFILNRGGLSENISEVYLFDALYGGMERFGYWLDKYDGRLVNITTPNGGTWINSQRFLNDLADWGTPFQTYTTNELTPDDLRAEKVVTIFTDLKHSEVINPYFELFLKSSRLSSIPD
ncbi:MAG: hypothetical protein K9N35_05745 [Candidatus Marinimicrobia bacterium]|nr:hypothetical protein [Candidatus Neomarinimicrobiota bacterium]